MKKWIVLFCVIAFPGFAAEPQLIRLGHGVWCGNHAFLYKDMDDFGIYWKHLDSGEIKAIQKISVGKEENDILNAYPLTCSPDGQWIGYGVYTRRLGSQQWIIHRDTGERFLLGVGVHDFEWSPDGKKIYYTWGESLRDGDNEEEPSKPYFRPPEHLHWQLLRPATDTYGYTTPVWLADSSAIVYTHPKFRTQLHQYDVTPSGLGQPKLVWDSKTGTAAALRATPDNGLIIGRINSTTKTRQFLRCQRQRKWTCASYAQTPDFASEEMADGSIVYIPRDSSLNVKKEIWIWQKGESHRLNKADNHITTFGLSPDDRYLNYRVMHDK